MSKLQYQNWRILSKIEHSKLWKIYFTKLWETQVEKQTDHITKKATLQLNVCKWKKKRDNWKGDHVTKIQNLTLRANRKLIYANEFCLNYQLKRMTKWIKLLSDNLVCERLKIWVPTFEWRVNFNKTYNKQKGELSVDYALHNNKLWISLVHVDHIWMDGDLHKGC